MIEHISMVYAADDTLTPTEKHLLGAYCNHTDAHGYCWPGIDRLCDETNLSRATVKRTNASLKKKGLIKSVRRVNPRTGEPITNLTRVNLSLLASLRRPTKDYNDNLMEAITFDEPAPDTPSDLLMAQNEPYLGLKMSPPRAQNEPYLGLKMSPKTSCETSEEPSSPPAPPPPGADGAGRGAGPAGRRKNSRTGTGRGAGAPAAAAPLVEDVPPVEVDQSDGGASDAGASTVEVHDEVRGRAERIVADAVARWHSDHRAPDAATHRRLVDRVAAELADGGDEAVILDALTRDLHPSQAASAVRVVMARTTTPGWAHVEDPRPPADRHVPTGPRPPWCGRCDERTRLLVAMYEDARGELREQMARCRDCHPEAILNDAHGAADGPEAAVDAVPEPPPLEELLADLKRAQRAQRNSGRRTDRPARPLPPVVAEARARLEELRQRTS